MNTSFETIKNGKDEWITPPEIVKDLGPFDLDPCSPIKRPWPTAKKHFTKKDNGLVLPWSGRVWLNPPYGKETPAWLQKMVEHGNGIALVFARTETTYFQDYVLGSATALLFIKGRLKFYHVDGTQSKSNAGAPSVLVAYGLKSAIALSQCDIKGHFEDLTASPLVADGHI